MPRRTLPPRLWRRNDGAWIILDAGRQHRTGLAGGDSEDAAREALARYILARGRKPAAAPQGVSCGELLAEYFEARREQVADPERLRHALKALAPFWGDLSAADVTEAVCARYVRQRAAGRVGQGTARRELGALQAALTMAHRAGRLTQPVAVSLPKRPAPRERWLTREEVRRLLRAAAPHLRRFILIALMTGRRKASILKLRWAPNLEGGWIDCDRGAIRFRGQREAETRKRRGEIPMPRQLRFHAARWRREDQAAGRAAGWVIHHGGAPIGSIKRAWNEAVRRAGIEDAHPHDLKRTAVTWAFQRGMSREDASGWFDTTAATLEAVYRQHSPEFHRRALSIMERRR